MAYGVKYTGSFDSQGGDRSYTVEILEDGFTGTAADVEYAKDGQEALTITWGQRGADVYEPIVTSEARVKVEDNPDPTIADDLATGAEDQFRLHVKKGGSTHWYGTIITDGIQSSTDYVTRVTQFRAIDTLGRLDGIAFDDGSGNLRTGRATMISIITECLDRLDLTDQINTLRSASDWYPNQLNDDTLDPLNQIDAKQEIFSDSEGDPMACSDVLRQVLQRFGCILFQQGGEWHVLQRELLDAAYDRWTYQVTDGTQTSGATSFDPIYSVSSAEEFDERLKGGHSRERQPYKDVTVTYRYNQNRLLANTDFDGTGVDQTEEDIKFGRPAGWSGGTPKEWSVFGNATIDRVTEDPHSKPHALQIESRATRTATQDPRNQVNAGVEQTTDESVTATAGNQILFGGYARINTTVAKKQWGNLLHWVGAQVILNGSSNTHYLGTDGTWSTSEQFVEWGAVDQNNDWHRGIPQGDWVNQTVRSDDLPEDGTITVKLYQACEDPDALVQVLGSGNGVDWDDIELAWLIQGEGEGVADRTIAALSSTDNVRSRDELELMIGDGPDAHPRRLQENGADTSDWNRGGTAGATGDSLNDIHARALIESQASFLNVHSAGYFRKDISQLDTLELAGTPHVPVWLEKQFRLDRDRGEWVELKSETLTLTETAETQDLGGTIGAEGINKSQIISYARERQAISAQDNVVTTTTGVISGFSSSSITSIPINPIGESLFEVGDIIVLIDPIRPQIHELTIDADQGATDTSLTIESYNFPFDIPSGAGILAQERNWKTARVQTENYLLSTARNNQIAELDEDVRGEVSSFKIRNMQSDIIIGEDLVVVNQETGERYEFTAAETQPTFHAGVTFSIEGDRDTGTARIIANEGDPIFKPKAWEQARQIIEPDQIRTDVRQERDLRSVGTLSQDVDGSSVTSLPMNSLETGVDQGQTIEVLRVDYEENANGIVVPDTTVWQATVSSDTAASPSSSTSIPINATEVRANAFSSVFVRNAELNSSIIQNVDEIILRVKSSEQMSELTINLESITVDTNILRSDSWDGSIDSSGSVTASTSANGWAITGAGEVDIKVSGGNVQITESGGLQFGAPSGGGASANQRITFNDGTNDVGEIYVAGGDFLMDTSGERVIRLQYSQGANEMFISSNGIELWGASISFPRGVVDGSDLPNIGNAGAGELGVDSNGFVKRA